MQIRKIVCRGFKTYRELTVLDNLDEAKLNCIVGLNGSGKSSIFHAINFVLSPLKKSGSFLHEGSMGKSLSGFVEIEFVAAATTLVAKRTISDREDEFSVNGKTVPRAEYVSHLQTAGLLGSTKKPPFYIVEQGRVGAAADRFDLLKEAAGIDVFDEKKIEANRVLEETAEKETKLEELVVQIDQKCDSLARDCAEMREFAELRREKDLVELELAGCELEELKSVKEQVEQSLALERKKVIEFESAMTELWDQGTSLGIESDRVTEELGRVGIAKLRENNAAAISAVTKQKETIAQETSEMHKLSDSLVQVQAGLRELGEKKVEIEKSLETDKIQLNEFTLKLAETLKEKRDLELELVKVSTTQSSAVFEQRICELDLVHKSLLRRNAMLKLDIHEKDLELARLVRELIPSETAKIELAKSEIAQLEEAQLNREIRESALAAKISNLKTSIFKAKQTECEYRREIDQVGREVVSADLQVLRNTNGNTRGLIGDAKNISGVVGLFGDFLTIPSIYRKAVESVGKNILFNVLIDSDAVADEVVKALKMKGKVTLVPLNRVEENSVSSGSSLIESLSKEGIEGCLLSSVIKVAVSDNGVTEAVIEALIHKSFSRTVLVESLEVGMLVARKFSVDTVTLDGDQVTKDLIVRGGGAAKGNVVRNWQFALDLKAKLSTRKRALKSLHGEILKFETELKSVEIELGHQKSDGTTLILEKRHNLTLSVRELKLLMERENQIRNFDLKNLTESGLRTNEFDIKKCELDILELTEMVAKMRSGEIVGLSLQEQEEQQNTLKSSLCNVNVLLHEIELSMTQLRKAMVGKSSELSCFVESRMSHLAELARESERGIGFCARKTALAQEELLRHEVELETAKSKLEETQAKIRELETARESLNKSMEKIEEEKTRVESEKFDLESKIKSHETKIRNLEAEIASCQLSMQRHNAEPQQGMRSIRELRGKVIALNKELSSPRFDLVNKKSIEQYERVSRERNDLLTRRTQLVESRDSIAFLLTSLNNREEYVIKESLESLTTAFNGLFAQVTNGGSVFIELENNSLSIEAAFPHVARKRLAELSGGQRTVVSLCFLLSLTRVGSSGGRFFVLDEVDAALDDNFREGIAHALELISIEGNQCFFTSFRPEFCRVANKHFLVSMDGGTSRIALTTRETALEFVGIADKSAIDHGTDIMMHHGA